MKLFSPGKCANLMLIGQECHSQLNPTQGSPLYATGMAQRHVEER